MPSLKAPSVTPLQERWLGVVILFAGALALASPAGAQAPPLDPRCAYVDLGQWLGAEPHMRCVDLERTCQPGETFGCFKRPLIFEETVIQRPGEPEMRVTAGPFGYIDQFNVHWDVPAAFETDGASIPAAFKPLIGGSWTEQYVRAAVLHDFYIRRWTNDPESVHRLFFHALLASGTEPDRAKYMYWAVRNFGPQWKSVDLAAYEQARQANLEQVRRDNERFRAEYDACLERHLDALAGPPGSRPWESCPLDASHEFILDLMTIAKDEVEKAAGSILDDFKAGRCVEVAPDKYDCP
jgi:hypothetical protein